MHTRPKNDRTYETPHRMSQARRAQISFEVRNLDNGILSRTMHVAATRFCTMKNSTESRRAGCCAVLHRVWFTRAKLSL